MGFWFTVLGEGNGNSRLSSLVPSSLHPNLSRLYHAASGLTSPGVWRVLCPRPVCLPTECAQGEDVDGSHRMRFASSLEQCATDGLSCWTCLDPEQFLKFKCQEVKTEQGSICSAIQRTCGLTWAWVPVCSWLSMPLVSPGDFRVQRAGWHSITGMHLQPLGRDWLIRERLDGDNWRLSIFWVLTFMVCKWIDS